MSFLEVINMVRLGLIWKPVVKGGHFPATYFRDRKVARTSEKVKAVNRAFTAAAQGCAGKKTSDGSFQACIAEKMRGMKAGERPSRR